MEPNETFGAWLRRRRRFMDMTQEQLANCAGCSPVTVRKMEGDERRPSRQLAELLANCLAVPAAEREAFVAFSRQPESAATAARGGLLSPAVGLAAPSVVPPPVAPPLIAPEVAAPVVLPTPLTGLLGRVTDVAAVGDLLLSAGVRLVTLTGPGGAGKTRLAIEVARQLAAGHAGRFPDGIYFVDLAALHDPALFVPAVNEALGLTAANTEPRAALLAHLRPRRVLLVLDNFEQITAAAGELAGVLQAAGSVAALVTSRALLRVYGEHEYQVAPLAAPPEGLALDELMNYPAVALFVERSRAVRPGFVLDEANAAAVGRLIARLDGLPLAIELAAARSRLFSPMALLAQLTGALDLASRQQRDERQRTMRAAIDWSYALLTEAEQRLFRALGVFAGGFGPAEAARLLGDAAADLYQTLDDLTGLVEKSMIRPQESAEPRFTMLAVLREYAVEQLAARGEMERACRAHAAYCLDLVQTFGPQMTTAGHGAARAALLGANDDLRAALGWTFASPQTAGMGLQIALALTDFWIQRGMSFEGQGWLGQGLAVLPEPGGALRARALIAAGRLAYYQGHFTEAAAFGRAALALLDDLPDAEEQWTIVALRVVGNASADAGDYDNALSHQNRILELYRRRENLVGVAQTLQAMGLTLVDVGRLDDAEASLTKAVSLFRRHPGDADDLMFSLNALGMVELIRGNYDAAGPALEEALALARGLDAPMWQAMVLNNLGHRAIPLGEYEAARAHFMEGGRLARESKSDQFAFQSALGLATLTLMEGAPPAAAWPHVQACLAYYHAHDATPPRFLRLSDVLALFAARAGDGRLAARLLARADALRREPFRPPRFANVQPVYERALDLIRQALDEVAQEAAARQGEVTTEAELLVEVEQIGQGIVNATPT